MSELDIAWLKDACPDCGKDVWWELKEASTGGDTYSGLCVNCGSHFDAKMKAELDYVERRP